MPEMIQVNDLVNYECPNCGYITKGKRGEKMDCPKCQPDFKGYILGAKNTEQQVQPDNSPKMCEECGQYPADLPSNLCCGFDAYKEHLS